MRAVAIVLLVVGCAPRGPSHQSLHVVDDQIVYSTPPPSTAYAAYLRCRLALEANPPRLDEAASWIDAAVAADPRDPQLWTVRGEIAARQGDGARAMASVKRALELSADYPAAKRLLAQLGQGSAVADN
jgi:cytochrome c-type biogenesis protein CcmH/NrfG